MVKRLEFKSENLAILQFRFMIMKFGVCLPNYGETSSNDAITKLALRSEELGFESLWATDHILMQKNSQTPYERIYESITTLSYISAITSKIRLGISSLIIAMRNPLVVAKQLVTLDNLSNGRVMVAFGTGWNETEFNFLGADFHNRGRIVDESIKLIKSVWNSEPEFHGKYIKQNYKNAVFEPRPVSKLEVWIGGMSEAAMKRAVRLGNAWHPNAYPLDEFRQFVSKFRSIKGSERCKIAVRIGVNLEAEKPEYEGPRGEKRLAFTSNEKTNENIINELEELGVSYIVLVPNHNGKVKIEQQIKSIELFSKLI